MISRSSCAEKMQSINGERGVQWAYTVYYNLVEPHTIKAQQHAHGLKRKPLLTFSAHEDDSMGLSNKLF